MMNLSKLFNSILANRPLAHILYWLAIFMISIIYGLGYGEPLELAITLKKINFPAQVMATYLFIYVQLPLLYRKRYWMFTFSLLASTYIFHIVMHLCNDLWFGKHIISYHSNHTFIEILSSGKYYLTYVVDIYMVVFVTAGIKLIKDNLENMKELESLEAEKAKKEYQYLQARMHPEFLLNTLGLIEQESLKNNDNAAKSIANLSEVLDYSLYKTRLHNISLIEECRQMKIFAQLFVSGSKTITSIQLTESSLSLQAKIKPMTLVNTIDSVLNYIEKVCSTTKSLTLETTSIDGNVLLDIFICEIYIDNINTLKFKSTILENISDTQLDVSTYSTYEGCNIQITLIEENEQ